MIRSNGICALAWIALGVLVAGTGPALAQDASPAPQKQTTKKKAAAPAEATAPAKLELEAKAMDILKAVGSRLAAANTLKFTAVETFESLSRQGAPLVYATKSDVIVQRPDKLRVIISGDGPASEFYYDGKAMMAYAPAENLVAIADAPPTIDAALESAFRSAAIYFPFTDLIVADPYGDMAKGLKHAYYIGQSKIVGGTTTDIVAFAGNGVFVQMWVGADDKLPRGMHVIYLDDPDHLRHNLILSDWQVDAPVAADVFGSANASAAKRMPFAHPHPEPAKGARPPTGAPAPATTTPPKSP
jgi:hypothetical protein